jgi:hypothetical protein
MPEDTSSFSPNNIVVSNKAIPGDFKLPLEKDSISVFSGGSFSLPVHSDGYIFSNPLNNQDYPNLYYKYRNPQYIEVDLPNSINLHQPNFNSYATFTEIADVSGNNPIATGYRRYKFSKTDETVDKDTQWGEFNFTLPIYLEFPDSLAGTPNLKIRYRDYMASQESRSDLWQEQILNCEVISNDIQLPDRLMTSFGVAYSKSLFVNNGSGKNVDDFLTLYKKLGFNTVSNPWNERRDIDTSDFAYSPEDRQSETWQDLGYGPGYSLFYSSNNSLGFFVALNPNNFVGLTKETLDSYVVNLDFNAKFKTTLVEPELSIEKEKWKKAIKFYFDSNGVLDMAYNGIILQKNLEHLSKFVEKVKPEDLSLDSEGYPYSFSTWSDKVVQSENAQSRKLVGETNSDLARRIIDEWTAGFTSAVYQKSPDTRIGMYGVRTDYNLGYQVIPWDILSKYNIIPQPTLYKQGHNLDMLSEGIRNNRAVLSQGDRLDPWLGIGWAGEFTSDYAFDQVIHTLLNGATGFSIYSFYELDDMADILEISKAIGMVSPHEDLIMDGQVAFGDISGIGNATVSAMKKDGEYLIGVTPKDKQNSVTFTINTGSASKYILLDKKSGESTTVVGPTININKTLSYSTVYSLKETTSSLTLVPDKKYAYANGNVLYSISYTNVHDYSINNFTISVSVSDEFQFVSAEKGGTYDIDTNKITWQVPALATNQEYNSSFVLKIK